MSHDYWSHDIHSFIYSLSEPPPGSGMSIAKQFLLTILTQFAERRVFIYLLRHNHKSMLNYPAIFFRQLFPPIIMYMYIYTALLNHLYLFTANVSRCQ